MIATDTITVQDDYSEQTDFGPYPTATQITLRLSSLDANGDEQGFSATVELIKGKHGLAVKLPEMKMSAPGWFSFNVHCIGFRIKNTVPGSAVSYQAQAWFPDDPYVSTQVGGVGPFSAPSKVRVATFSGAADITETGDGQYSWTWNAHVGETDLFDLTNPLKPKARADGLYTIAMTCRPQTPPGNVEHFTLAIDVNSSPQGFVESNAPFSTNLAGPFFAGCSITWPMRAGDNFDGITRQHAGSGTLHFFAFAYVTRLTPVSLDANFA